MVNVSSKVISNETQFDYRKTMYKLETPPSSSSGIASDESVNGDHNNARNNDNNHNYNRKMLNEDTNLRRFYTNFTQSSIRTNNKPISRENSKSLNSINPNKYKDDDRIPKMSVGSRKLMGYSDAYLKKKNHSASRKMSDTQEKEQKESSMNLTSTDLNANVASANEINDKEKLIHEESEENGYEMVYDSKVEQEVRIQSLSATNSESSTTDQKNYSLTR